MDHQYQIYDDDDDEEDEAESSVLVHTLNPNSQNRQGFSCQFEANLFSIVSSRIVRAI